ncbi:MAG: hypothetical protein GY772_00885, partial [bacterium]|nr:hypothetical protein [bacterium]
GAPPEAGLAGLADGVPGGSGPAGVNGAGAPSEAGRRRTGATEPGAPPAGGGEVAGGVNGAGAPPPNLALDLLPPTAGARPLALACASPPRAGLGNPPLLPPSCAGRAVELELPPAMGLVLRVLRLLLLDRKLVLALALPPTAGEGAAWAMAGTGISFHVGPPPMAGGGAGAGGAGGGGGARGGHHQMSGREVVWRIALWQGSEGRPPCALHVAGRTPTSTPTPLASSLSTSLIPTPPQLRTRNPQPQPHRT